MPTVGRATEVNINLLISISEEGKHEGLELTHGKRYGNITFQPQDQLLHGKFSQNSKEVEVEKARR